MSSCNVCNRNVRIVNSNSHHTKLLSVGKSDCSRNVSKPVIHESVVVNISKSACKRCFNVSSHKHVVTKSLNVRSILMTFIYFYELVLLFFIFHHNTSTLIDHILTNFTEKIFQSGVIDSGTSDHQLIFCKRKVKRVKFHEHNNVVLKSLKHYTVNLFVKGLQKVNFLNYERFSNIDAAYNDFLNKLMKVINEIDPGKEIRIKNNNQDCFHREIADLIHVREKLFLKFILMRKFTKKLGTKFKT